MANIANAKLVLNVCISADKFVVEDSVGESVPVHGTVISPKASPARTWSPNSPTASPGVSFSTPSPSPTRTASVPRSPVESSPAVQELCCLVQVAKCAVLFLCRSPFLKTATDGLRLPRMPGPLQSKRR